MAGRRILVTGGTGFLGSALVRRLVRSGEKVKILDDNSRGATGRLETVLEDVELVEGDVRDAETVHRATEGADTIVHLAAVNGTAFFYENPELVLDVGVRGMLNVLAACRAQKISDLVVASSSEVYHRPPVMPTDETVPLVIPDVTNPRYSYAGSKILTEIMALNYWRDGFERVVIVRPHNVYGPDMGWEHVLPQFALRAAEAVRLTPRGPVPFRIQGSGCETRAFIHIDDFTDGLMTVIAKGGHREIYHIGTMDEIPIAEVARKVVAYFGRDADIVQSETPAGSTPRRCPDIAKLMKLGFAPRTSLDEGLPSLIDWYAAHAGQQPLAASAGV